MPVHDVPLKAWLKGKREINALHLEVMTLQYDFEGAVGAKQYGLAWWAQNNILVVCAQLFVIDSDLPFGSSKDRVERVVRVAEALGRVNSDIADSFWGLLMRPEPDVAGFHGEIDRTFDFIEDGLGLSWAVSREESVKRWADSTNVLRSVAKNLNMAQSDDWYLSVSDAPDSDWYGEVLRALEEEQSQK